MKKKNISIIDTEDIKIAYKTLGNENKPAIVMIMGYGCLMEMWPANLIEPLSVNNRLVLFDNRGMGFSTATNEDFSIELFASDTSNLMERLNIKDAHIIGWSMGSFIAQELALRYARKVKSLTLLASSCGGKKAIWNEAVWSSLLDITGTFKERTWRMFRNLFPPSWFDLYTDPSCLFPQVSSPIKDEILIRQSKTLRTWKGSFDRLKNIRSSTLIISGNEDIVIPFENSYILEDNIPNSQIFTVEGGGHGFFYQYPNYIAHAISRFIASPKGS